MNPPTIDLEKARRENIRWLLLQTLNSARPVGASESVMHSAITAVLPDITIRELRIALEYLEGRDLLEITGKGSQPLWFAKLRRHGIDLVEYTIDCEPGIARPQKYW